MANPILKLLVGLAVLSELDIFTQAAPLNDSVSGEQSTPFKSASTSSKTELGNLPVEISLANSNENSFVQEVHDDAYVKTLQKREHEVRVRFSETDIEAELEGDEGKIMDTKGTPLENVNAPSDDVGDPENVDAKANVAEVQTPTESEDGEKNNGVDKEDEDSEPIQIQDDTKVETSSSNPQMDMEKHQEPQQALENIEIEQGENEETNVDKPSPDGIISPAAETSIAETLSDLNLDEVPNKDENEEATAIPQLHGTATHHRPIENNESEILEGRNENNDDDDDGFVKEDESSLKDSVITSVLEAEAVTDGFDCSENRGPFRLISSGSKHFVDVARLYNFREAREVCSKYNLVVSEVEGLGDHRTMEGFMTANNYYDAKGSSGGSSFFIGLNDIKTEGVFRHANGKNLTYQNFLPSQPDDKNEMEDCVVITKENRDGPAGAADYDCNKIAHVFCMFRAETQCYNESKETMENRKLDGERGFHLLVNATERAYFVSNYQVTWKEAMKQCDAKQMKVFNMDGVVTMGFFRSILKWEKSFFRVKMPTVQYWTSGKFQKSHMNAPIIWHAKPELTESEERGVEKHNSTFSFSGLYHWSTAKKRDPGVPHGWRRDLCVSFGFDKNPEAIPYIRNTNCDLPAYFICYVEYPDVSNEDEDEPTDEDTDIPFGPGDKPFPLEPVNETEIEQIEIELENEGRFINASCDTKDEDTIKGRNGIIGERYRWTYSEGFVVYIDPSYNKQARKQINAAMDKLRKVLCIPFYLFRRNQRPYGNYVHIKNLRGCNSDIGRIGGAQEMSLADWCLRISIIMHEMIHALGYWHEQSRPDRDDYVTILWDNISQQNRYNFRKVSGSKTFGVPYNTLSIMHYAGNRYSSNGRPTIVAKNGGPVGTQGVLQQTDIDKLRKMYRCD
ncbi:unnamed protein product [Orchesella dallaii]|uniref:Metalloendopeptidase n=1 Tax=Orchesella dallaii TaxID=48710 RepID=A0ABP1PUD1_9HEXA